MDISIFLKYPGYRKGLRLVITDTNSWHFVYNTERKEGDEFFDGGHASLCALLNRFREVFGQALGDEWYCHVVQQLFRYHVRKVRQKRARA
ncbi:MAG: hypothetical protein P4L81_04340 [Candidatus Pacebacteria bacterium]|nr:hypothetical protein [Candidatus Paceibacterota bacterium]